MNPEEKIEEFIRQLDFTTNPDTDKHILDDAVAELEKSTRSRRPAAPVVKIAAAVIVLAAIVTGLIILQGKEKQQYKITKQIEKTAPLKEPPVKLQLEQTPDELRTDALRSDSQRQKRIEKIFAAGNVDALMELLEKADLQTRTAVANYLTDTSGTEAITLLKLLSGQYGGHDVNNPFAAAIQRIRNGPAADKDVNSVPYTDGRTDRSGRKKAFLELEVVNKNTGKPLGAVKLDIKAGDKERLYAVTDSDGRHLLEIGRGRPAFLRVRAAKSGFVPVRANWHEKNGKIDIPSGYTFSLEPGTEIGGIVKNEAGEPVKAVSVLLAVPSSMDEPVSIDIDGEQVKTDANGVWMADFMPAEISKVNIRLKHPDYISDSYYNQTVTASVEDLRRLTSVVTVIKKGLPVTGYVADMNGQPIASALVMQGSDRGVSDYPDTRTGRQGIFRFEHCRTGKMVLTVQAAGFAPELKEVPVNEQAGPIGFRLGPAYTIRGRIVDVNDEPVEGAWITADTWRGHRSIRWNSKTGADGCFKWNQAPSDEVLMDVSKSGCLAARSLAMSPSVDEYIVTLSPELKVSGIVIDADTNEPIDNFSVVKGYVLGPASRIRWEDYSKEFTSGRFNVKFSEQKNAYALKVTAGSYVPAVSENFTSDSNKTEFEFALEKADHPAGTVYLPDETAAEGAKQTPEDFNEQTEDEQKDR